MNRNVIRRCWISSVSLLLTLISVFVISRGVGWVLTQASILPHWGQIVKPVFWWINVFLTSDNAGTCASILGIFTLLIYTLSLITFFVYYYRLMSRKVWRFKLLLLGAFLTVYAVWCFTYYSELDVQVRFMRTFPTEQSGGESLTFDITY